MAASPIILKAVNVSHHPIDITRYLVCVSEGKLINFFPLVPP